MRGKTVIFVALLGIIALGAFLRLWDTNNWFNYFNDYDEGAWSLAARFISQGYLPYRDFPLVHPPLYELMLASVYKLFGYNFFYGRYFSVAFSLASIILMYLIGRKMYHSKIGFAAAALFATSPLMVYLGRRAVQESVGLFFILLAIYFCLDFIKHQRQNRLFFCGLALGLAVATKYTLVPAVVAVVLAVVLMGLGRNCWESVKKLGTPKVWAQYFCLAAISFSLLLLAKYTFKLNVSIPIIEPLHLSGRDATTVIFVFVIPLVTLLFYWGTGANLKQWGFALYSVLRSWAPWMLALGIAVGFLSVVGFFWLKAPQEFISQTILIQGNRQGIEFPSFIGLIRIAALNFNFMSLYCVPIILAIPLILILLNKQTFSAADCFVSLALIISFLVSQVFMYLPRYYASIYPFLLLGIASMAPNRQRLTTGLLAVIAVVFLFVSLSLVVAKDYRGYDIINTLGNPGGKPLYQETLDFLERVDAKIVYADSPTLLALSTDIDSVPDFDTFAFLYLRNQPPKEVVEIALANGADYLVLGPWVRSWGGFWKPNADELVTQVRQHAKLIKTIGSDPWEHFEIYLPTRDAGGIFNQDFGYWFEDEKVSLPLAWEPIVTKGVGDRIQIKKSYIAGRTAVKFEVYENGIKDNELGWTHAGFGQKIQFPSETIKLQIYPQANTTAALYTTVESGIHFMDEGGHMLIVAYSDKVDETAIFDRPEDKWRLVVKKVQLNEWSEQTVNVAEYWSEAGWKQPNEVFLEVYIAAHHTAPGNYALYVGSVR